MKKQRGFGEFMFFLIIAVVVIAVLASCNDENNKAKKGTVNQREHQVLTVYSNQVSNLSEKPSGIYNDLAKYAEGRVSVKEKGFFCDGLDLVRATEYRVATFNQNAKNPVKSPSTIYEEMYGQTVEASCGIVVIGGKKKTEETPKNFTPKQEAVRGNKLTPEMYDRMIESANYCARSKAYMMDATKNKGVLTTDDYDGLMDAVLECKRFELEQTLQQK